jgi:hypothetical protein
MYHGLPGDVQLDEDVTEILEVVSRQWKVVQTVRRERFASPDCKWITQPPVPFRATPARLGEPEPVAHEPARDFAQAQPKPAGGSATAWRPHRGLAWVAWRISYSRFFHQMKCYSEVLKSHVENVRPQFLSLRQNDVIISYKMKDIPLRCAAILRYYTGTRFVFT